jgi:L-asparagine transporter-like permease
MYRWNHAVNNGRKAYYGDNNMKDIIISIALGLFNVLLGLGFIALIVWFFYITPVKILYILAIIVIVFVFLTLCYIIGEDIRDKKSERKS